jgi:hypothetical protein
MAWIALAGGAPGVVVSVYLLGASGASQPVYWTLLAVVAVSWLGAVALLRARLSQSLRTISNILMAFREGDYSLRAAKAHRDDPLGEILVELNLFSETLRSGRLQTVEASLLLEQVIASVDVALFAFDERQRLRLINPAGAQLIGRGARDAMGEGAGALGLAACLHAESGAIVALELGPRAGRYTVLQRRVSFRAEGLPHTFRGAEQRERCAAAGGARARGGGWCACWGTRSTTRSLPSRRWLGALRAHRAAATRCLRTGARIMDHALEVIEGARGGAAPFHDGLRGVWRACRSRAGRK